MMTGDEGGDAGELDPRLSFQTMEVEVESCRSRRLPVSLLVGEEADEEVAVDCGGKGVEDLVSVKKWEVR